MINNQTFSLKKYSENRKFKEKVIANNYRIRQMFNVHKKEREKKKNKLIKKITKPSYTNIIWTCPNMHIHLYLL